MKKVEERIIKPTIEGLHAEQIDYKGFIFFGLINVDGEPYVIEYNCRMGDPETEVVIPRLENDLVGLFISAAKQELDAVKISIDSRAAATIVAVSGGYPGPYEKGYPIEGLQVAEGTGSLLFHSGTAKEKEQVTTNGGRVLCITSFADSIPEAVSRSSRLMEQVHLDRKSTRLNSSH